MNSAVRLRTPRSEKPTVRGGRARNTDYRQREYLTEGEIDSLLAVAGNSRNPVRDRLLILVAFRHALRERGFDLSRVKKQTVSETQDGLPPARFLPEHPPIAQGNLLVR